MEGDVEHSPTKLETSDLEMTMMVEKEGAKVEGGGESASGEYPRKRNRTTAIIAVIVAVVVVVVVVVQVTVAKKEESKNRSNSYRSARREFIPGTKCLDGSLSAIYFESAKTAQDARKWHIHLRGGGFCSSDHSCYDRLDTSLGGSGSWPSSVDYFTYMEGALWHPHEMNLFQHWNRVVMPYCSGDLYLGRGGSSWGVHFEGSLNFEKTIDHLISTKGMNSAEQIYVTGLSAGGVGVMNNIHILRAKLPSTPIFAGTIGGLLPVTDEYTGPTARPVRDSLTDASFKRLKTLYGATAAPLCKTGAGFNDTMDYKCLMPKVLHNYLDVPLFVVESRTDYMMITLYGGVPYRNEEKVDVFKTNNMEFPQIADYIESYERNTTQLLNEIAANDRNGVYAPACFIHTKFDLLYPRIGERFLLQAQVIWMQRVMADMLANSTHIDSCSPAYPPCSEVCPATIG